MRDYAYYKYIIFNEDMKKSSSYIEKERCRTLIFCFYLSVGEKLQYTIVCKCLNNL